MLISDSFNVNVLTVDLIRIMSAFVNSVVSRLFVQCIVKQSKADDLYSGS